MEGLWFDRKKVVIEIKLVEGNSKSPVAQFLENEFEVQNTIVSVESGNESKVQDTIVFVGWHTGIVQYYNRKLQKYLLAFDYGSTDLIQKMI